MRRKIIDRNTIKKAILFECEESKNNTDMKMTILDEVVDFYLEFHHKFKHLVHIKRDDNSGLQRHGSGVVLEQYAKIKSWLDENDILYMEDSVIDYSNGAETMVFLFASKEDAAAFKLKWEN